LVAASSPPLKLPPPARLAAFGGLMLVVIACGTFGFHAIQRWSWFDAFYKAVTTLTSLGSPEVPLSKAGRAFTAMLALIGVFTVALAATEVLRTIVTGDLRTYLENRRMQKRIEDLEQHVIVCGYGRVGRYTCAHLRTEGVPFVVIDKQDAPLADAAAAGAHPVPGDATSDAVLRHAGIDRARALIVAASTDSENVLITMTARLLNPTVPIVARAAEETTVPKLLRAGATRTVSPYAISGGRIAQAVLRPAVLDFIEVTTGRDLDGVQIAEQEVLAGSALDRSTVGGSGLRSRLGLVLLAVKRSDGQVVFNPGDDAVLAAGDTLIVAGPRATLDRADQLTSPAGG
jgi:voltage-gated potassium channel